MTASTATTERVRALAEKVLSEIPQPKDHWEVAAQLEVSGIRDVDALQEYGCQDVFELAQQIAVLAHEIPPRPPARPPRPRPLLWRFIKDYTAGLLFSVPMAAQIFAMILFGYSLWAWVSFSSREATAIALGTVTSFIVTGGYTQAISRRGLFYIHQQEDILTKAICYRIFGVGLLTVAGVGVALFAVSGFFELLPVDMVLRAEIYYFLLSMLWLSFSILYMLRKQLQFAIITLAGILVVHVTTLILAWDMMAAHAAGLVAATVLSFLSGWITLFRRARRARREVAASELPRASMLVYVTAPYFWYGILYFVFLFADRMIAWSATPGRGILPFFIWFDSRYELGMDWALVCFLLTVGVLEFTIREFSERIIPTEQAVRADRIADFNRRFTRFYYSHLALFLVIACLSIAAAWTGINVLGESGAFPLVNVFFNPVSESVFWWAAAGYVFLVFGLFNSVFLFALSRPGYVLRALIPALALNILVGYVLSRTVRYDLAVVGLTVGALAFLLISSFYAVRTFRSLDYYYYSAY